MNISANINLDTGIAYGYISAQRLDSDLVTTLINKGVDEDEQEQFDAWKRNEAAKLIKSGKFGEDDEDGALADAENRSYEFWEEYEPYEPTVTGEHEGVRYASSWLGGALNFFIFESPVTTDRARLASPCVPNAGILDTLDGSVTSYDVPADWRCDAD